VGVASAGDAGAVEALVGTVGDGLHAAAMAGAAPAAATAGHRQAIVGWLVAWGVTCRPYTPITRMDIGASPCAG